MGFEASPADIRKGRLWGKKEIKVKLDERLVTRLHVNKIHRHDLISEVVELAICKHLGLDPLTFNPVGAPASVEEDGLS